MKEIYNVLEDLFRRCLKKSNVFSFYFERYESKSLALKTPNQNTSIWVFLKQIMLVGKCRLLILLCNRLFSFFFVQKRRDSSLILKVCIFEKLITKSIMSADELTVLTCMHWMCIRKCDNVFFIKGHQNTMSMLLLL